ncbi:MAG: hypothetical protein IJO26_01025 [Clostridium sp.]|nr:hypothetical protein [Clostridium sp.]
MDKKEKNRIIIPIICLLLSTGLWFYVTNVENKIRTTEISKIPVELINEEALASSKLAITPGQEFYVTLKVEGNTNDINKIKKSDFKVQVDLSEYAWKKGENKVSVSIVDYPITVSIRNTNTLSITINIEDLVEKTLPITSELDITPAHGYFASDPVITPEKIKVSGAESVVTKVAKLVISDIKSEVEETIVANYKVKALDENNSMVSGITLSEDTVTAEVKISKGKSVKVNIATTGNLPNGVKMKSIDSSRSTVELLGPKETLDTIESVTTTPIDLSEIKENKEIDLSVIVPDGTIIVPAEQNLTARVNVITMVSKKFTLKLNIKGIIDGLNVLPSKENIEITLKGYEDAMESVTEDNFEATIDVSKYKEDGTYEVTPVVKTKDLDKDFKVEAIESIKITVSKEIAQTMQQNVSDEND